MADSQTFAHGLNAILSLTNPESAEIDSKCMDSGVIQNRDLEGYQLNLSIPTTHKSLIGVRRRF